MFSYSKKAYISFIFLLIFLLPSCTEPLNEPPLREPSLFQISEEKNRLLNIDEAELREHTHLISDQIFNKHVNTRQLSSYEEIDYYMKKQYNYSTSALKTVFRNMNEVEHPNDMLMNLRNSNILSSDEYSYSQAFISDLLTANSYSDIKATVDNFDKKIYISSLTFEQKKSLYALSTVMDIYTDELYSSYGIVDGVMCGMAVSSWGVAAVGLVVASGGVTLLPALVAGIGYSLSTASLAACFL